jgi:hypothetical protein
MEQVFEKYETFATMICFIEFETAEGSYMKLYLASVFNGDEVVI